MPLLVSCPGPLLRLACLGGGGPVPVPPYLAKVRRSPSPDCPPTGRAVGVRYPRAVGAGVWVWGPNTVPLACMPCGGCVSRGWCDGGPSPGGGGVACHCCEGRQVSGVVPPPTARPLGGLPGPTTHLLWVRGGAGVGTHHQPHSARSCELALRAVGLPRGRPGGAPPAWVWGFRGRALSHPRVPALWAGCRGPLPTGCGCRGVRAWGPAT